MSSTAQNPEHDLESHPFVDSNKSLNASARNSSSDHGSPPASPTKRSKPISDGKSSKTKSKKPRGGPTGQGTEPRRRYNSLLDDQAVRKGFIVKVYGILCLQLAITALACLAAMYITPLGTFMATNLVVMIIVIVFSIIFLVLIYCFNKVARTVPWNYVLLILFTLCESYIVASVCASYQEAGMGYLVLWAAISTAVLVAGLTAYAWFSTTDITMLGGVLFCCCIGLLMFTILALIVGSSLLYAIVCGCGLVLFGIYLVFDTQLLLGNKRYKLSEDDYLIAALNLYIDIVMIFLYLLELLGWVK